MSHEEATALIKSAMANPTAYGVVHCAICGASQFYVVGLFQATEEFSRRIGAPAGKRRDIVYGLCRTCYELPDVFQKVEASILRDMQVN